MSNSSNHSELPALNHAQSVELVDAENHLLMQLNNVALSWDDLPKSGR